MPAAAASVAATAAAQAETARIAAGSLPAPPPLSAPLGMAGTGPMPQLSQTMAPPGETMWWRVPASASAQARPWSPPPGQALAGPASRGYHPSGSAPYGSAPYGSAAGGPFPPAPGAPPPGPSAPAPPGRAAKPQPGPVVGAIALGLGIVLLVIGAASHAPIIVIGGLVAGAWGIWRLVTASGNRTRPPGPN